MRMFRIPQPGRCATCELGITGRPVLASGLEYCCMGCVAGGPCVCSYEADLAEDGVDNLGLLVPTHAVFAHDAGPAPEGTDPRAGTGVPVWAARR